jgi:hypothetical protein
MFIGMESIAAFILLFDLLLGGALLVPLLMLIFGLGVFYTQAVLFSIGFWPFWYKGSRKLSVALGSGFYVSLLDLSYSLGVLRGLL